jgi:hypothetical protein
MKNINIVSILLMATLFVGCKNDETKNNALGKAVVEETTVNPISRESDTYFSKALASIKEENRPMASKQIIKGVDALLKEGKDVIGQNKENLDMAIGQLRNIAGKLNDNFDVSEQGFKEAVANAEINIAHNYLATDDVFMLTPKDNLEETKLHRVFEVNLKKLEVNNSKLKGKAKTEGQKLTVEGNKLKKEYEAWKKKAEAHNRKTIAYFKKYNQDM